MAQKHDSEPTSHIGPRGAHRTAPAESIHTPSAAHLGRPERSGEVTGEERERLAAGFGARLRELRTAVGMTQARAAAAVGIAERAWQHLERGRRRPSAELLGNIVVRLVRPEEREAVLDALLALGGDSVTGSGRRRFRKDARAVILLEKALAKAPAEWRERVAAARRESGR